MLISLHIVGSLSISLLSRQPSFPPLKKRGGGKGLCLGMMLCLGHIHQGDSNRHIIFVLDTYYVLMITIEC